MFIKSFGGKLNTSHALLEMATTNKIKRKQRKIYRRIERKWAILSNNLLFTVHTTTAAAEVVVAVQGKMHTYGVSIEEGQIR